MIISHKHKFIFIKTNKTAGTSVEIALSKHCGPEDVITPISPEDEAIRRELGHRGPQNYLAPFSDYGLADYARLAFRREKKERYYNHISAAEVRPHVGEEVWIGYYKFCVERNPWERVISMYYWRYKSEPRPAIREFIASGGPNILKERGIGCYTIDGRVAVDKVCRFECLDEELEGVRIRVGIPEELELPRAKSSFRKDRRSYREILGDAERAKVAELFRDEIALMGYEP